MTGAVMARALESSFAGYCHIYTGIRGGFPRMKTEVWMTILESGWNLWVLLMDVVSRRWVWLVGGIYGYG